MDASAFRAIAGALEGLLDAYEDRERTAAREEEAVWGNMVATWCLVRDSRLEEGIG